MKEVAIRVWDDIVFTQTGEKVEAQASVVIGMDGLWAELDLAQATAEEIREQLAEWMKAGRVVSDPPARRLPRAALTDGEEKKQWGRDWEHGRAWGEAIREFARANDIPYMTEAGKYYYSKRLRDAYAKSIGRE